MQKWTKARPNSPGYWWALEGDVSQVCQLISITDERDNIPVLYCDDGEDYIKVESKRFDNWLWGSYKLAEPMGEKYDPR